jgi:hypothetical protein
MKPLAPWFRLVATCCLRAFPRLLVAVTSSSDFAENNAARNWYCGDSTNVACTVVDDTSHE